MSYLLAYNPYNTNLFMRSRSIDPAAQDFIDAAGITGDVQQQAINNLVKGLKSSGLWSKMKAVYPFVTDNRNLLNYTEDLSNVAWTKSGVAVTTGQIDPNGGTNAFRVQGTTLPKALYQTPTLTTSQTYTLSFYIKRTGGTNQTFRLFGNNSSLSSDFTATDTWQRFTYTVVGTTATDFGITRDSSNNNYDVLVWHPQLELGSSATTYQPIATTQQAYIASQFKYNLKDPRDLDAAFRLVFNGGWTHSSTGATPNGTNGYADTKLVPSSVLAQNSAHLSFYSRTDIVSGVDLGSANSLAPFKEIQIAPRIVTTSNFSAINASGALTSFTDTSSISMMIASRIASTEYKFYRAGTLRSTQTNTSDSPNSLNIYLSARNNGGSAGNYSVRQAAFASIGDGLLDAEAAALYSRVQNFQLALNRAV